MKRNILYALTGFMVVLFSISCTKDEKYTDSIVRKTKEDLTLNGVEWDEIVGLASRPIFVFKSDGDYVANYTSHYSFPLAEGDYYIVATPAPSSWIPEPINLNDLIIDQPEEADVTVQISGAIPYSSPFMERITVPMKNRTGNLRFRSTDRRADKTYSIIRAIIETNTIGFRVKDETYITGDAIELRRQRANTTGGVNYQEDFILFPTVGENAISGRLELLNADSVIVGTKEFSVTFRVFVDSITLVEFQINDTDNPIIQDYEVTIHADDWEEEELNPVAPFDIPDGYTLVLNGEDLNGLINEMLEDDEVSEIKLYLIGDSEFTIGGKALTKSTSIWAQEGKRATINSGGFTANTPVDGESPKFIHFENLDINTTSNYLFNNTGSDVFQLEEVSFINCRFLSGYGRSIWRVQNSSGGNGTVAKFTIDKCYFNYGGPDNYAFFQDRTSNNPFADFTMSNTTVIFNEGQNRAFFDNTTSIDTEMNLVFRNNTIITRTSGTTVFDMQGVNMPAMNLTLENNLFSGVADGSGGYLLRTAGATPLNLTDVDNYRTSDYLLNNWGAISLKVTSDSSILFTDPTNNDFTIVDTSSDVYTYRIGDPRWLD